MPVNQSDRVLIVGAGCFGASTAYALLQRGFKDVTVLDRADVLPAPDAASTDINKIVRTAYSDPVYTKLAQDAIKEWKSEEWGDTYHESGIMVLDFQAKGRVGPSQVTAAYKNDVAIAARLETLPDGNAIRNRLPSGIPTGNFENASGYLNEDGGWANAAQGVHIMITRIKQMGASVIPGKSVTRIVRGKNGESTGVECADGTTHPADVVVLAGGSWTASSFPDMKLEDAFVATGQSIVSVQLTEEEAALYRECPVIWDFDSAFYIFPPNEHNIVKMAAHLSGYTRMVPTEGRGRSLSTPRTCLSHSDGLRIPKAEIEKLKRTLRQIYPALAEKPFTTRLCWYNDSPDSDWVIGSFPSDPSVILATAGSGHAYKFLPVIGRIVADAIEGTLDAALAKKFAPDRVFEHLDTSRPGPPRQELRDEDLCSPEDLIA